MKPVRTILKIASKIDKKDPVLSDQMERLAYHMNIFMPHSELMRVHQNIGGGSIDGHLGGMHFQAPVQGPTIADNAAVNAAVSLWSYIPSGTVPGEAIMQAAENFNTDPSLISEALQKLFAAYSYGVTDVNQATAFLTQSGPINMQLAAQNLHPSFGEKGITPQDVMEHEIAHSHGATASFDQVMQEAMTSKKNRIQDYINKNIQGANIPSGMGGQIMPMVEKQVMESALKQYMGEGRYTDADELGASKKHFMETGLDKMLDRILK